MVKFDIFKTLSLDFLGAERKECYIKYRYLSIKDMREISEYPTGDTKINIEAAGKLTTLLQSKFVEGKALVNGEAVFITAGDLEELPVDILNRSLELLAAGGEKKEVT